MRAFVLSGGASLGAVQVGMLRALDEADVRPDLLVGTSAGAVNAAWIAGHPGPGTVPHRYVIHVPIGPLVMVDDALIVVVSRSAEVRDGQVPDRYVRCMLGEGVKILVLTVDDRARSPDERVAV